MKKHFARIEEMTDKEIAELLNVTEEQAAALATLSSTSVVCRMRGRLSTCWAGFPRRRDPDPSFSRRISAAELRWRVARDEDPCSGQPTEVRIQRNARRVLSAPAPRQLVGAR